MFDVLIRNGEVIDGSGAARRHADVAVQGERIAAIGPLEGATARQVIDATGCVVAPGFVDMHSHADQTLPILPTADSLVHQGITTVVAGQCGMAPAPLLAETRAQVIAMLHSESAPLPWQEWDTFASFLDYLRRTGTSINVVPLVGQGMVRAAVMGFAAQPPDDAQLAHMQDEIIAAMDAGAIGVSSGLIYPPGSYASTEELIAVVKPCGERNGFYFSHIRGEGTTLLEAVAEAIRIGRETGAAVQISHFKAMRQENWHKSALALAMIEQARAEGLDVTADLYPYLASSTGLPAALPEWALEGGKEATLARLRDATARQAMTADMQKSTQPWDKVLISQSPARTEYEGRAIADLAAEAGQSPIDWVMDALLEAELDIGMIRHAMSEENRRRELQYPYMMIGTDAEARSFTGLLARGKPHPRAFGTFPRVLGHYVREEGVLSLEEAIYRMCGLPAARLRWRERGLARSGFVADLVVFAPDVIADRATFADPHQAPAGIHYVLVNGQAVIAHGAHTQERPGRVLGRP